LAGGAMRAAGDSGLEMIWGRGAPSSTLRASPEVDV